jgi:hypothetical protein
MSELRRAHSPFRIAIPEDLITKLRELRAQQRDWSELIDSEDVVHLFYGLGPGRFLAFDGRVLVDPLDWDGEDPYEVTEPKEAWAAIAVGANTFDFPELLRLLPNRPPNAKACPQCKGTGWWTFVDAVGNEGRVVCYYGQGCGGLGWIK